MAAKAEETEVVAYLLEKGAKPNVFDFVNSTPLHLAVQTGNIGTSALLTPTETVKVLLKAGARSTYVNSAGFTAKKTAETLRRPDLAALL